MTWQVRSVAALFDRPDVDAANRAKFLTNLSADDGDFLQELERSPDQNWLRIAIAGVNFQSPAWARVADLVDVDVSKPLPVDLTDLVEYSTTVVEDFNATQLARTAGVSRNYVLALAIVLNDLETTGFTNASLASFDPFHLTVDEWQNYCNSPHNTKGYQTVDRFDPLSQIDAAAYFVFDATSAITHAFSSSHVPRGPYVASSMDLFLVHMLGV